MACDLPNTVIYLPYMAIEAKKRERQMVSLPAGAHRKLRKLAEIERRPIASQADVIIDEALRSRGIDPETLEPITQEAPSAS